MKNTISTLVLLLIFSASVFGQGDWWNQLKPNLIVGDSSQTSTLQESMQKYRVNSLSLGIIDRDGNESYSAFSNGENFEKIASNTLYQAGSISKPVAALGVMVLVKKYNLDLDISINQYLKSWQIESDTYDASKVTLRNLLSHTAGFTVHGFMGYRKSKKVPEITEILNGEGNSDAVTMFNHPDSTWSYSGGGYQVLHLLIEDVSGMDFAQFLQQEVLTPIGMSNSSYELFYPDSCTNCAHAYDRDLNPYKPDWYLYPESAAAGLWTTPEDLIRFLRYLAKLYQGDEGIVSTSDVRQMFKPVLNDYGFGFFITERNGETYVGHSGKNIGFSNDMCINLDSGEGFVCMTDSDGAFPMMEEIKRSIPGDGVWHNRPQVVVLPVEAAKDELMPLRGKYVFEKDAKYKVKLVMEEGQLIILDKNTRTDHTLIPTGDQTFVSQANGISMEFVEENGQMILFWGNRLKFVRK